MEKNITIKDIAKKFKCSASTVSRALNDHPAIHSETKKTICEYAQRMGYQKNTLSLSLLNKSTKTIGVIVPSIKFSHENAIIEGIQSVLTELGYMLVICITNEKLDIEKSQLDKLLAHQVDALLVSISQETYQKQDFSHFYGVRNRNTPIVFIDRTINEDEFSSVTVDDYNGAYMATNHLIKVGCKKIAYLCGPSSLELCQQRLSGFLDCLKKNHLSIVKKWIVETNFDSESAIETTQKLFAETIQPDGLFCVNDNIAYGAIKVLTDLNKRFPTDVAVIGFDDSPTSLFYNPTLSTINRKSFEVGKTAALHIKSMIDGNNINGSKIILSPELKFRQTTKF